MPSIIARKPNRRSTPPQSVVAELGYPHPILKLETGEGVVIEKKLRHLLPHAAITQKKKPTGSLSRAGFPRANFMSLSDCSTRLPNAYLTNFLGLTSKAKSL